MGCHTWFSRPILIGKEAIKNLAQKNLNKDTYYDEDFKKMYQYAIDNDLKSVIEDLAGGLDYRVIDWVMYEDVDGFHDIVRISGYPETIVRSYEEMTAFVEAGFTDEDGDHHDFYYEVPKEKALESVKEFFNQYPTGIITFG